METSSLPVLRNNDNLDLFVYREDSLVRKGLSSEPNNELNVCTTSVTEDELWPVKHV